MGDTMARGMRRQLLNQDITTMDMAIMVDMDTMDIMERGKLLLNQDTIIMNMVIMEDMDIMDTMAREKLNLVIIIMVMVMDMVMVMAMDIMVKQQIFIDFLYIQLI